MKSRAACLALLLVSAGIASAVARELELEIIQLRHRLVRDVIPQLQPLLDPAGTLTGNASQLIVRTTPENLEEIRTALGALDVAATRLVISVSQARVGTQSDLNAGGTVTYSTTGNAAGPGSLALEADVLSTRQDAHNQVLQSVLVLDGQAALINIGQSSPVPFVLGYGLGPGAPGLRVGVDYQSVSSGFYVTPHLFGENVELALNARLQQGNPADVVQSNGAAVTVSGRLGSWIPVGGTRQQSGNIGGNVQAGSASYQLWVKVDRAP
jgi:type II secretory pathway component GspD/PulD (secretin)